jgi:acetyl-CoA synthetase
MPKTRSGKIMRRVIAGISNFADVGDVTTLANPEIVDEIRHYVESEKVARGEVPRELTPEEVASIKAFGQAECTSTSSRSALTDAARAGGACSSTAA